MLRRCGKLLLLAVLACALSNLSSAFDAHASLVTPTSRIACFTTAGSGPAAVDPAAASTAAADVAPAATVVIGACVPPAADGTLNVGISDIACSVILPIRCHLRAVVQCLFTQTVLGSALLSQ